ncbi:sigma-70 family RNA polymerase sigma factor [Knoellia sp. CPCC 206450]|uniref:sigma-70 family RNA polymerase sigma factor n=1 Tax=Knoellia tibetensis TaxID=3404798 RepID=UPI003B437988
MTVTTLHPLPSSAHPLASTAPESRDERCARAERLLEGLEGCSANERERRRQEAVLLSLELADMVARRYRGRGIEDDDLVQVARMALVKAVRGYRPGRGHSFAAYAVPTVSGEVKRYFRDKGWAVRPPRRLQERRVQLLSAEETLRHELAREPNRAELAERLGLDLAELDETAACFTAYHAHSLDMPARDGGALDVGVDGEDETDRLVLRDALGHALAQLTDREQAIVRLRFVEECTQSEIGAQLGVSQMQVSRLLSGILRRLRCSIEPAA